MKRRSIQFSAAILMLVVLWSVAVGAPEATAATTVNETQFAKTIAALQEQYPHGKYWNQYNGVDDEGIAIAGDEICPGVATVDYYTCVYHGTCAYGGNCTCDCGYYHGWQCFGFANLLCYKIFGSYATDSYYASGVNTADGWQYYTSVSEYYAGDNVRINNAHSIFLLQVTQDTVYYADCNATGPCQINWQRSMSLSDLKSKTTYVVRMTGNTLKGTGSAVNSLTIRFHAGDGSIRSAQAYKVTTDGAGLWLRSGAGTGYDRLVLIPDATTLTITETVAGSSYTWGKTTYGGYTGWCAISDGLTERQGYYLDGDGIICAYPSETAVQTVWTLGGDDGVGLRDPEQFGLYRDGYTFAGWSLTADGTGEVFSPADTALKAEDIYPAVEKADQSVVLYAVWQSDAPTLTGKSFSLSYEDEILVNFYFTAGGVKAQELGLLVFNADPGEPDIQNANEIYPDAAYDSTTGRYMAQTAGIPAKEMGDSRYYAAYAKLADGTYRYSKLYAYSPKTYAMNMLGKDSTSDNQKALCVAMLNYGAEAQKYFCYQTDALMNAELTDAQQALAVTYSAELFRGAVAADEAKVGNFVKTDEGFSKKTVTVSFEGAFSVNYYFTPSETMDGSLTFYYWTPEDYAAAQTLTTTNATGKMVMAPASNGAYWAQISGIPAKSIDDTYYVAAFYTSENQIRCTGVIGYSLSKYCMNKASSTTDDMSAFCAATAVYGYHAKRCFG